MMAPHVSRQAGGLTVIFRSTISFNSIATGIGCLIGLAAGLAAASAHATDLTVVHQSALEFVCMFDGNCRSSIAPAGVAKTSAPKHSLKPPDNLRVEPE
jgi:hypothetical protein